MKLLILKKALKKKSISTQSKSFCSSKCFLIFLIFVVSYVVFYKLTSTYKEARSNAFHLFNFPLPVFEGFLDEFRNNILVACFTILERNMQ